MSAEDRYYCTGNNIILDASVGHILDPYMGDRAYILMVLFLTLYIFFRGVGIAASLMTEEASAGAHLF